MTEISRLMFGLLALLIVGSPAAQTTYPSKPVRLVVGVSPGGAADTVARMIGQKLSEKWGQPVVVENRTGAGGVLAASMVAKAAPDGYTLLFNFGGFATSAALQPNLPYNALKDFAGVAQVGFTTPTLVVPPALRVKSVKDLIAIAQAQPGKIMYSSAGAGTVGHLSGARFSLAAGVKLVHVAFKGGSDAVIEVVAGRVHFCIQSLTAALPFINDGKLLALAVLLPQRSLALPEVPTLAETLPEFKRPDTSQGLLAPAGTPRPILNQISKEVARILDLPEIKERLQLIGYVSAPTTPGEYDKILREQIETLSKLVRDAGLRAK